MLEKWYVWDGVSTIKNVKKAISFDGQTVNMEGCCPLGSEEMDNEVFVIYTLGEPVESKRG